MISSTTLFKIICSCAVASVSSVVFAIQYNTYAAEAMKQRKGGEVVSEFRVTSNHFHSGLFLKYCYFLFVRNFLTSIFCA